MVTNRNTGKAELQPADPHMTVYMGKDLKNCYLQGHIFLVTSEGNIRAATANDRVIVRNGSEPADVELWDMIGHGGASTSSLRNRPQSVFGPQWKDAGERTKQRRGVFTSAYLPSTLHTQKSHQMQGNWRSKGTSVLEPLNESL